LRTSTQDDPESWTEAQVNVAGLHSSPSRRATPASSDPEQWTEAQDRDPILSGGLGRRRAQRQVDALVAELRSLIDLYDAGEIDLASFGWAVGSIGATLGSRAARGLLAVT
jgi:hypothetical protein